MFQSLTWVERLSDLPIPHSGRAPMSGFNPSPGLNVFQTNFVHHEAPQLLEFQSLTWVERLSDLH